MLFTIRLRLDIPRKEPVTGVQFEGALKISLISGGEIRAAFSPNARCVQAEFNAQQPAIMAAAAEVPVNSK